MEPSLKKLVEQDVSTTHKLMQLFRIEQAVSKWIDKQGHDKCWYYPEIFKEILDILEIPYNQNNQEIDIPRKEFEFFCNRLMIEYQNIARRGRLFSPTSLHCPSCLFGPISEVTNKIIKSAKMTDIEQESIKFEKTCSDCRGGGYDSRYIGERRTCPKCNGIGMMPTEIGEKVLELVMHNLKSLLKELTK